MTQELRITLLQSVEWLGQCLAVHEIGEYSFVEYNPYIDISNKTRGFQEFSLFAAFINGKKTGRSYETLDAGLVGVIACKYDGGNTKADRYFIKSIGADRDE